MDKIVEIGEDGFVKVYCGPELTKLLKHPHELTLLTQIALCARLDDEILPGTLKAGQALIGDYKSVGLTASQYHTAKVRLERWGHATFKTINQRTIAQLCNTEIFDINP